MSDGTLSIAEAGDALSATDMQASIDDLLAMADDLNDAVAQATDVDEAQGIARAQQDLRSAAQSLVDRQIALLAGEVKITADHINAATRYAKDVIAQVVAVGKKLKLIAELIGFFAAVTTGSGAKILSAAVDLKGDLDACKKV